MTATPSLWILAPALAWVMVSDLLYRRISNVLVGVLLLLWAISSAYAYAKGLTDLASIGRSLVLAFVVLALGYVLFVIRWMGAGDAKLMAVLCLWLSKHALAFLMVTALAGGALALALPALQQAERILALWVMRLNTWLPRQPFAVPQHIGDEAIEGIPYGLAIAFGAAFILWLNP